MKTPSRLCAFLRATLFGLTLLAIAAPSARPEWITLQVPLSRASDSFSLLEVGPGSADPDPVLPGAGTTILDTSVSSIQFIGGSFDALGNWLPGQNSYALLLAERAGTGHFWLRDNTLQQFAPRDQTAVTGAPWVNPASNAVFRRFSIEAARATHALSLQFANGTTFTMSTSPEELEYDIFGQPGGLGFFLAWVPDTGLASGSEWIIDHDVDQRTSGTSLPVNLAGAAWESFTGTTPTHQVAFLIPSASYSEVFQLEILGCSASQISADWWEGTAPDGTHYSGYVPSAVVGQNYLFRLVRMLDYCTGPWFRMGESDVVMDAAEWMPAPPVAQWESRSFSLVDILANHGALQIRYADCSTSPMDLDGAGYTPLYSWDDLGNQQSAALLRYNANIDVNRAWWIEQARGAETVSLGQESVQMEGWAQSHLNPPAGIAYAWVPAVRQGRALRSSENWVANETGNTITYSFASPGGGASVTWAAVLLAVNIDNGTVPFTLSDPVSGDVSPPMSPGGTSDFSTWFPGQPLVLKISGTRWGKNLVIRTPLGDLPITRHQMQGDWSRDASGAAWFDPYGYFDATATAYEGLPWWLVDMGVAGHPATEVLTPAAGSPNDFIASTDNTNSDTDPWPDWYERLHGTNPYSADTDGDGLLDHLDPDPRTRSGTAPGSTLKVYTQLR